MNGMTTQLNLRADEAGDYPRHRPPISAATASPTCSFNARAVSPEDFDAWAKGAASGPAFDSAAYRELEKQAPAPASLHPLAEPDLFDDIVRQKLPPGPGPKPALRPTLRGETDMLGKLTWDAIPFDQPIPLVAGGVVGVALLAVLDLHRGQGLASLSLARVDHQRRPQAHRRDVRLPGAGHAAARLHRRADDALAAGARLPVRRLSAARALQPDLLRARHDHDLLRRHAVRDRADEFRRAAAARRARRRLSDAELGRLLADRVGRAAGQHLAGRRRILAHRLAALPAAVGTDLFARRRRRLLSAGRCRFPASARC